MGKCTMKRQVLRGEEKVNINVLLESPAVMPLLRVTNLKI